MFIATVIASGGLSSALLSDAEDALRDAGIEPMGRSWVERDIACDLLFSASPRAAEAALEPLRAHVDIAVQGEAGRRKRLLVADMDSTVITVECIDELADFAGVRARVAEVTERAMRGEFDFEGALEERVALLKGLPERTLARCYEERVKLTPGAKALAHTMRAHGARCLLVSGGFTYFADRVAQRAGFDRAAANRLEVADGALTGTALPPVLGAQAKKQALIDEAIAMSIDLSETMAVGDGANDIPMIETAGLGVAYHGKAAVNAAAQVRIAHNDLGALLYLQGYARAEWR
ncbi:phosphoserine phosphatase SerB [Allosphingosinicella indica]|uniref:Phosphoserine phosphatase n=1 Tax=Allosphingosinicella indica TaxID=941907 RepID=A0A1X7H1S9_9SPHN|nr:phosphoserine phosphatase SerB [Allosphingosinicella indica]SMF78340.1 phosphoserine phosphatase [Allosphingosinicella indica]